MKRFILVTLVVIFATNTFSQNNNGEIRMDRNKFYMGDERIKGPELKKALLTDPIASPDFKIYSRNNSIGSGLLLGGTVLMATGSVILLKGSMDEASSSTIYSSNDQKYLTTSLTLVGIGAVVAIIGAPFGIKGKKHLKKSIELYNSNLNKNSSSKYNSHFEFGLTNHGIGLRFSF